MPMHAKFTLSCLCGGEKEKMRIIEEEEEWEESEDEEWEEEEW